MLQNYKFQNQHLVTILASIYALVSVQNIAHFFISLNRTLLVSYMLSVAICMTLIFTVHTLNTVKDIKVFSVILSIIIIYSFMIGWINGVQYVK